MVTENKPFGQDLLEMDGSFSLQELQWKLYLSEISRIVYSQDLVRAPHRTSLDRGGGEAPERNHLSSYRVAGLGLPLSLPTLILPPYFLL